MNIKIANRLVELRREAGLSQEELAAKLGISRQAISKWERAESSPDTDNLISLANLYHCSLDDLLGFEVPKTETKNEDNTGQETNTDDDEVTVSKDGIFVRKKGKQVQVHFNGIKFKDSNGEKHIGSKFFQMKGDIKTKAYLRYRRHHQISSAISFAIMGIATILYLIFGFMWGNWHPGWLIFILAIVLVSIVDAILKENFHEFAFPVLAIFIYLVLGFYHSLWHPGWIVFLAIPLFYIITPESHKKVFYYQDESGKTVQDYGNPEDQENYVISVN